ncbi:uncharacterized protein [Bemisia tabaci]|uniref:uncharacterized protein n=1 Tax=Bemisia tabaci TaxID=7038 RepID=UPI0008F9AF6D|nr:PREDICTED: cyanate hydratase-like [Bemisia tabaci]
MHLQAFHHYLHVALASRTKYKLMTCANIFKRNFSSKPGPLKHPVALLDQSLISRLPVSCITLFEAKKKKNLTFEAIAKKLNRDEVAVAALFYGQAKANEEDVKELSNLLDVDYSLLCQQLYQWPDRGRLLDMPPKDPLIYRFYEIIQNYGYAYKAILNEKFGDGIMSAVTFSTHVEKETDEKGDWVKITWRGKWLPFSRF